VKPHIPGTDTPSGECGVKESAFFLSLVWSRINSRSYCSSFSEVCHRTWPYLPGQRAFTASSFATVVPEDVNETLLETGGPPGVLAKAKLFQHMTRYPVIGKSRVVTVQPNCLGRKVRFIEYSSPGISKRQYHVHRDFTRLATAQYSWYFRFAPRIKTEMVPPVTLGGYR
jgi:hypothetical protein